MLDFVAFIWQYLSGMGPFMYGAMSAALFAGYAPLFIRHLAARPTRALVRLAWSTVASGIGGLFASSWLFVLHNSSAEIWVALMSSSLTSILLAMSLRYAIGNWKLSVAPLAATPCSIGCHYLAGSLGWGAQAVDLKRPFDLLVPLIWSGSCALFMHLLLRWHRRRAGAQLVALCCSRCGYPLTGLISPDRCPECGATFAKAT